jgi:hypothetical protein
MTSSKTVCTVPIVSEPISSGTIEISQQGIDAFCVGSVLFQNNVCREEAGRDWCFYSALILLKRLADSIIQTNNYCFNNPTVYSK